MVSIEILKIMAAVDKKEAENEEPSISCILNALPPSINQGLGIRFKPNTFNNAPSNELDGVFSMNIILNQFVQFVPVLTLSNFMRSFPDYEYDGLPSVKKVFANQEALDWGKLKLGLPFLEPNVKDFENMDSAEKSLSSGYRETRDHSETRVFDMSQLITLFFGSWRGLDRVNEMIILSDSVGLDDLVRFEANYIENKGQRRDTLNVEYFCLLFLNVIFPIDPKTIRSGQGFIKSVKAMTRFLRLS